MDESSTTVTVKIEIPKGSRNKYEFDEAVGAFRFDRMLFSAVHYPSDYWYIMETLAEDGDSLDALVLVWEPTFPGCLIVARPVGLFKMLDEGKPDDKVLCVPEMDPLWNHIRALEDVPPHLLTEMEHFFSVYKDLERKRVRIQGWKGTSDALHVIGDAHARWLKKNPL
jgi:inorganic pyrophosphatase